ncbi:MAG: LemA family protein [Longimicrobiales bacterium]
MKSRYLLLPAILLLSGCGYNKIQELDEQTSQMSGNIQTELQRRNDLIPNLVATVDQAAKFESTTQTRVAEARSGLTASREQMTKALAGANPDELAAANQAVSTNLRSFLNVSIEAYPDLKSNQNFIRLQDELTETENRISVSRRDYNTAVNSYNTYIRKFPAAITAKVTGAKAKKPFAADPGASAAPKVEFKN